jgi:hypothetical protein
VTRKNRLPHACALTSGSQWLQAQCADTRLQLFSLQALQESISDLLATVTPPHRSLESGLRGFNISLLPFHSTWVLASFIKNRFVTRWPILRSSAAQRGGDCPSLCRRNTKVNWRGGFLLYLDGNCACLGALVGVAPKKKGKYDL